MSRKNKPLEELSKAVAGSTKFYDALHSLLLELKALDDDRIKALFVKYQVEVE